MNPRYLSVHMASAEPVRRPPPSFEMAVILLTAAWVVGVVCGILLARIG